MDSSSPDTEVVSNKNGTIDNKISTETIDSHQNVTDTVKQNKAADEVAKPTSHQSETDLATDNNKSHDDDQIILSKHEVAYKALWIAVGIFCVLGVVAGCVVRYRRKLHSISHTYCTCMECLLNQHLCQSISTRLRILRAECEYFCVFSYGMSIMRYIIIFIA